MKDFDLCYEDDEKPFKGFKFTWNMSVFVCGGGSAYYLCM